MRAKTMYAQQPEAFQVVHGDDGTAVIRLRENIEQVELAEEQQGYQADEYEITVPWHDGLFERVSGNVALWLERAKSIDYAAVSAAVRAKRDALLSDSDKDMVFDRMGLVVPSGATFTAWLAFLRSLGDILSGHIATYRQSLRDLPEQPGFPYDVSWPSKPADR